jgi:hypothetical protein
LSEPERAAPEVASIQKSNIRVETGLSARA